MSGEAKTLDTEEVIKVLEQLPEGVMVLNDEKVIQFANKTGARLVKIKPKTAVGTLFEYPLEDGPMRDFDVELTVKEINWGGTPASLVHLKSLKNSGAFHLEWKLEAAVERTRELEEELAQVKSAPATGGGGDGGGGDTKQYEDRITELESLLELAELRADEMQQDIARDDHQQATELQDAISRASEAEEQLRQVESDLEHSRERIRAAEEQAEVAEERAYSLEAELEEVLANADEKSQEQQGDSEAKITELQEQIAAGVDTQAALLAEKEEAQQRLTELEGQIQQANEKLEDLEEQRETAVEESQELAEQLRQDSEQFETRLAELKSHLEQVEGGQTNSQQQVEQLQAEKLELQKKIEGLEPVKTELESRVEQLNSSLEAAAGERDSLKQELENATQVSQERSVETTELQGKVAQLEAETQECESLRKEIRRMKTLLENAEELAAKGEKVEKLERKLEGALRRAEEAEDRLQEERRLLQEAKQKAERLTNESRESQALGGEGGNPETERLAFQDNLTGLPNRNIIQRYLGFMLKQSARYNRLTAMLRVDCDNFKTISDTFGVEIGDELIRCVGERLSSVVRGSDVLGRYGEDEFIMLLSEMADKDEASVMTAAVIKRLYQKMKVPFQVGEQAIEVGVSVGVSIFPLDANNGEQMFEHAGVALRRAKETGRGQAQYFTQDLQTNHVSRLELDSELKSGFEQGQFEMLYQPIFDLSNGQVVGVESLIRWRHPTKGILGPDDFLQIAEDSGMIVLIGNWALRQALESSAKWNQQGLGVFVSVNLSRRQLLQADLLPMIQSVLADARCSPDRLLLEIPEQLTGREFPKVQETLSELQRLGVRLAVDNFGTSSTSLQELRRGPFQVIKVDRNFVSGVPNNEENAGIVLSALTVGHHLGRVSIAVGVESETEKAWLAQMGCRFAQGNHLSEPLLPAQITELAKRV